MNNEEAKNLAQMYVEGWKANDVEKILESLAGDCIIIESHGPTYHGHGDVKEWVENWVQEGYKVDKWDITSFLVADDTAVFEWQFRFSSQREAPRSIEGITIMKFKGGKISQQKSKTGKKWLKQLRKIIASCTNTMSAGFTT